MAKLFYTLEEASEKLGMSEDDVRGLVSSGQLQEFRDGDRLMFKVEQVDLLAGGEGDSSDDDDDGLIPLAGDEDESGELSLASESGTGIGVAPDEGEKEKTGIGFFEVEETEEADPSAVTQMADEGGFDLGGMSGDAGASGSGLMDLTREADDTSLGADLLEGLSAGDEGGAAVGETVAEDVELFESTESDAEVGAGAAMVAAEPYDGTWSGLAGGFALAMVLVFAFTSLVVIGGLTPGGGEGPVLGMVSANLWPVVGGMAVATLVLALIGWVLGRRG